MNDFVNVEKMQKANRIYAGHIAGLFLKIAGINRDEAGQQALQPGVLAGFQSLRHAPKRTVCETGDARPQEGGRIAGLLQRSGGEKWSTQAAYRQRVVALRQGSEKAPLAREVGHKTGHNPCPCASLDTRKALC